MKHRTMPVPTMGRQMNLEFEPRKLEGLADAERRQAITALTRILMQAAGLVAEEVGDDQQ